MYEYGYIEIRIHIKLTCRITSTSALKHTNDLMYSWAIIYAKVAISE